MPIRLYTFSALAVILVALVIHNNSSLRLDNYVIRSLENDSQIGLA